jgi:hypothetical protein
VNADLTSSVYLHMKAILLPALLIYLSLIPTARAQACREVVRDASGRVVQTIERQPQPGGRERVVIRDATGRIASTATTCGYRSSGSHLVIERTAAHGCHGNPVK